jgi:ribosomal protein S18 acetylase RimI-like enzyme
MTGADGIRYRRLALAELGHVAEIDRTERIREAYVQHGDRLEEIAVDWDASPWLAGSGEHSVAAQQAFCERHVRAGGVALGAFSGGRLVGIGVVTPNVRPGIAQLAYLHVGNGYRGRGIGARLTNELEGIARTAGDTEIVVSATPSKNTVRFYRGRGYEPTATPLPELLELEPEDIHLCKAL